MGKLNIVVLCGGESVESDISVITGLQTFNAINTNKYNKHLIYIDKAGLWYECENCENAKSILQSKNKRVTLNVGDNNLYLLKKNKLKFLYQIHCAVLALHGGYGENGGIQGLLNINKIPYTACDNISSGLTMDKCFSKLFFKSLKLKVLPFLIIRKYEYFKDNKKYIDLINSKIEYPCIIKPSCLGSSIGIGVAHNVNEFVEMIENAFMYDNKVLVEKALTDFDELNISARTSKGEIILSDIEKPFKQDEILSFKDKYINGSKNKLNTFSKSKGMATLKREFPASLKKDIKKEIENITTKIYKIMDLRGIVRFDFILNNDGVLYLNEINSIPGSLSFYLWGKENFSNILDSEIDEAIKYYLLKKDLINTFSSSIFN